MASKLTTNEKNLIRRYLVWCYKTTKEELDRIDRRFTQLKVDYHILKRLSSSKVELPDPDAAELDQLYDEFKEYISNKEKDAEGTLTPKYFYLKSRLAAIEESIVLFLGKKDLALIMLQYEKEMTRRILEAREHS